ncbi:MAG TPA: PQQ-dependent sugar dehydrogenase, partial [Burkholderiales bacterium]|nr:PQQ-dependent sugar dehydrogenase [Burkholderiales bacterium]
MAIGVDLVASGLDAPTFAASAPGVADQLYITERYTGRVTVLDLGTNQVSGQAFFDVPAGEMSSAGEGGLLGLAFHPNYAINGKAYLHLTNEAGDSELWEITRSGGNPAIADPSSARVLMTVDRTATNHVGGWIGFGPDGYLYIASGDSGGAGDPQNAAQNVGDLRGKMLRIDVNGDAFPSDPARNYAIPAGNPFDNEVFAYGLRNPWRASFDSATGDLYIGDVGQAAREEIDFLAAGTGAGTNFGWRVLEGTVPTSYPPLDNPPPNDPSLTAPIHEYGRVEGRTIIGGYVYRGPGGD